MILNIENIQKIQKIASKNIMEKDWRVHEKLFEYFFI